MNQNQKFDAIILDIDGTIWNTTTIVAIAWNRAIDISGFLANKVTAQDLQKEFGKTMDVIAFDLWPNLSDVERTALMSLCCSEEQIALKDNVLDICYESVCETVKKMSVTHNFYVVSNCQSGYIELMLAQTGLEPYIKDYECFGNTGKGKAENLQLIISRNRIQAPVYIGDTRGDEESCIQCGIPFIWAAYGFGEAHNYYAKIDSFSEIEYIV